MVHSGEKQMQTPILSWERQFLFPQARSTCCMGRLMSSNTGCSVLGRPSENLSAQSEQKNAGGGRSERWVSGMEWSRHILVASHGSGAAHRVLLQISDVNEPLRSFTVHVEGNC